jgi:hypothetical protein
LRESGEHQVAERPQTSVEFGLHDNQPSDAQEDRGHEDRRKRIGLDLLDDPAPSFHGTTVVVVVALASGLGDRRPAVDRLELLQVDVAGDQVVGCIPAHVGIPLGPVARTWRRLGQVSHVVDLQPVQVQHVFVVQAGALDGDELQVQPARQDRQEQHQEDLEQEHLGGPVQ